MVIVQSSYFAYYLHSPNGDTVLKNVMHCNSCESETFFMHTLDNLKE